MSRPAAAIEVHHLSKKFDSNEVLSPFDLSVPHGSIFALLGHNGAGKTTLIKLLLNILVPSSGSATVLGQPTTSLAGPAFTRIGYISENQELPDWMTVQGLLDYLRPFYPAWDETGLLEDLDLPADRKLGQLSRGMRMKAMFASVLAFKPSLILMDEPFAGLDVVTRDMLIRTLMGRLDSKDEHSGRSETTILISSHELAEIETFATHVAFLHEGRLLFAEPMANLIMRFREVTVRLSSPEPVATCRRFPADWLSPELSGAILRFTYTGANMEDPETIVRREIPGAEHVDSDPMNLQTIFLALAKANRTRHGSLR
jgi:ABC-2 type transport system ATP-binding protein